MPASLRGLAVAAVVSLVGVCTMQFLRLAPIGNVLAFAIYFIMWWVSLFVVLPFGVETQSDTGEIIQGTSAGAPTNVRIGRIAALTTLVASAAFTAVLLALRFRLVPLE